MREVMFELLSYEPFEQYGNQEADFIRSVLSGSCNCTGNTYYEELFSGFYNNRGSSSLSWLATWISKYHTSHTYPVLIKKICYYYMVNHKSTRADIAQALGITPQSASNLLNKWNLYIDYRRTSEDFKMADVPINRRGKKAEYLVEFIQKTYYESWRKTVNENRLSQLILDKLYDDETSDIITIKTQDKETSASVLDLPVFVDVFGGTGVVASSMNVSSSYKVVNDFDEVVVATLYALVYYPDQFIEKFREFNVKILQGYYEQIIPTIPPNEFTQGVGRKSLVYYTNNNLNMIKMPANNPFSPQKLQLLKLIRNAWFYSQYVLFATSNSATQIRNTLNINHPHTSAVIDKICEFACYFVYYHHDVTIASSGKPDFRRYDEKEHYKLLEDYFDFTNQNVTDKVTYFSNPMNLQSVPVKQNFLKDWRDGLQDAIIGNKSFEEMFPANVEQQVKTKGVEVANMADRTFYYLDSPYFLKTQYAKGFTDEMHKIMLDNLRGSDFNWIFSMQCERSDIAKYSSTRQKDRIDKEKGHIYKIEDYGEYYKGFLADFKIDKKLYVSTYDEKNADKYKDVYVILPDSKLTPSKKYGIEILVTNVDTRRITPYGDDFIQISMKKFLDYFEASDKIVYVSEIRNKNKVLMEYLYSPNAHNPHNVKFNGSYPDLREFAKTEYEKELTP